MLKFLEKLAETIQDWNDAEEEPDERGRGNNLMCLIIAEDGSGLIGTIHHAPKRHERILNFFEFRDWYDKREPMVLNGETFSTLEELEKALK